MNEIKHGFLFH